MSPLEQLTKQHHTQPPETTELKYSVEPQALIELQASLIHELSNYADTSLDAGDTGTIIRQITEDALVYADAISNFSVASDADTATVVSPSFGDVFLIANAIEVTKDSKLEEALGSILINTPPENSDLLQSAYYLSLVNGTDIMSEYRTLTRIVDAELISPHTRSVTVPVYNPYTGSREAALDRQSNPIGIPQQGRATNPIVDRALHRYLMAESIKPPLGFHQDISQ